MRSVVRRSSPRPGTPRRVGPTDHPAQRAMAAEYGRSATLWSAGTDRIYRRFAAALVRSAPMDLAGRRVVDVGAGSGALSAELRARGAEPLAVDLSPSMLGEARRQVGALPAVAADAASLPLGSRSADALVSAFLVNHLPEPHRLLREAARVVRRGGLVMVTTFSASGGVHPAKAAVDAVARRHGWRPPAWFAHQQRWAAQTDTPEGLAAQAEQAALPLTDLRVVNVEAGPLTPAELAGWRLGHAHLAGFVTRLPPEDRCRLVHEAEEAAGSCPQSLRRDLLILSSRLPA